MEKVAARTEKVTVGVLGGGNASHVYIALLASRGYDVHVFADFGDEAVGLNTAGGEIRVSDRSGPDGKPGVTDQPEFKGRAKSISKDASAVVPKCDVLMCSMTPLHFPPYLEKIKPHLKDGCVFFYSPGQGGADMLVRQQFAEELDSGKMTFCPFYPMPFNCRIMEFGKLVGLSSFKEEYDLAACPPQDSVKAAKLLSELLGKHVASMGNMAALHLLGGFPNIYPCRSYGMWKNWDGKTPYKENPLFYETWDDASANVANAVSTERCGVWRQLVKITSGAGGKVDEVLDLRNYIARMYGTSIKETGSTKTVFSTNAAIAGLKSPMKETGSGWVPDFENRHFADDIPESFAIYKGIADLVGCSTPTIDAIFLWAQKFMGKEYVTGEPGYAKLNGRDVGETKSPQAYGYFTLSAFLGIKAPKPAKMGINGFGRIGRLVLRASIWSRGVQVVAVNDPFMDLEYMVYLLNYDSVHGGFTSSVAWRKDGEKEFLVVNGEDVRVFREKEPKAIGWGQCGAEYICESSGVLLHVGEVTGHLEGGAKKVVISNRARDMPMLVMGVNHETYKKENTVVSISSCTVNCLAPLVKCLHDNFGIVEGLMTTVHAMSSHQLTVDGPMRGGQDWRGGRCASQNVIPAHSGCSKDMGTVIPEMVGKLRGIAFRVPVLDVSVVDFTVRLEKAAKYDEILEKVKENAAGPMAGILDLVDEEVVSTDFIGCRTSSVVDGKAGIALNDNFVKMVAWFDNEWGYANRICDLVTHMQKVDTTA